MTFPCEIGWNWPEASENATACAVLVHNASELRRRLADIQAAAQARHIAIAVNVMTLEKNAFSVVLGLADGCIVTYDGKGGDPPYFVSLGEARRDTYLVSYFYGVQRSELPASHLIPEDVALDALIDSIENEEPSPLIDWYGG